MPFKMVSDLEPAGDQPEALEKLREWIMAGVDRCTLLGVTGSGKTFTMARLIEELDRPVLVLAPNKTLAAQLYSEFKVFFPENAIEYFVSYYDYYQPEAYVPTTDTCIEKDATINEAINRMRNSATRSLMERRDVLIVASISCIYGLGSPEYYRELSVSIERGQVIERDELLRSLATIQYRRDNLDFVPGRFRVRGDVVEIYPVYEETRAIRLEFFDDVIEAILGIDPLRGEVLEELERVSIYPSSHYVAPEDRLRKACATIEEELAEWLPKLQARGKALEAQRLEQRARHDLEMMRATGMCSGIENYSRHLDGRMAGDPPATLLHYFPSDYLLMIDESHVAVPQSGAMCRSDRSRKQNLVEYGFRLPSALDNRPLTFEEFCGLQNQVVYVSATPAEYERRVSGERIAELVVRPTGLVDPEVEVRPAAGQVDDLLHETKVRAERGERVLVTTLTKRMAEELTDYFRDLGVKVRYLHSDIDSLERSALIRDLRLGVFDCLIGINLLREGLDIPEVTLVAILDADKEGFLRNRTSLIQTCGRAARNVDGRVVLYADTVTASMRDAMDEMARRRERQSNYNHEHGITPTTIVKEVRELLAIESEADSSDGVGSGHKRKRGSRDHREAPHPSPTFSDKHNLDLHIRKLREEMLAASKQLEFELAASIRDEVFRLEKFGLEVR